MFTDATAYNQPLGILRNTSITNRQLSKVADMWFDDRQTCQALFGHISQWNVSEVTILDDYYHSPYTFRELIYEWDTVGEKVDEIYYLPHVVDNDSDGDSVWF